MEEELYTISNKLIKKYFGNHNSLKNFLDTINYEKNNDLNDDDEYNINIMDHLNIPLLVRQVATNFYVTSNNNENIVDTSYEINQKLLHNSYIKHCLKEYKLNYVNYNISKCLFYKFNIFIKLLQKQKKSLPIEIILEIKKYIF